MSELRTFAYTILSCSRSEIIHEEIRGEWLEYNGDVIEAFLSLEGQADAVDNIWPFDWDEFMSRVAPVQLTQDWNPLSYLLALYAHLNITPSYQTKSDDEGNKGYTLYFDHLPTSQSVIDAVDSSVIRLHNSIDQERFFNVLIASIVLARKEDRGILFMGDWGWDYHVDAAQIDDEVKTGLSKHGLEFLTRHA